MTNEEKELYLKDLCARQSYGVMMHNVLKDYDVPLAEVYIPCMTLSVGSVAILSGSPIEIKKGTKSVLQWLSYLRHLSDMTEAEKKEYDLLSRLDEEYSQPYDSAHLIDWLNAHHFDYRGLIEKGLAIEAPEGMYEFKEVKVKRVCKDLLDVAIKNAVEDVKSEMKQELTELREGIVKDFNNYITSVVGIYKENVNRVDVDGMAKNILEKKIKDVLNK